MSTEIASDKVTKADVVGRYLSAHLTPLEHAEAFAPSNIALCKYWGKRQDELNLPVNSSLSISLAHLGSRTVIRPSATGEDKVILNAKVLDLDAPFASKVIAFVDLFRRQQDLPVIVDTRNNIPTAAGLASSASGFAALTLALNQYFQLQLPDNVLSAFARMGSGSASRSIFSGFVEWQMGLHEDGMDSHAYPLDVVWPDFRVGLVKVSTSQKAVDSRSGMKRTVATASLYQSWPAQAAQDLEKLHQALAQGDFTLLGSTAEHNAMSMHATMIASWPPLLYWQPDSVAAMQKVWALREAGIEVYFTMDAGPNLKLLFQAKDQALLETEFAGLEVVAPFSGAAARV
ncbi:diphosphomevalonate decarboxylase [Neptunomonas antarctica]|uniref:diphosphomevalonate decarboxylase n=1 Tax=Neptunomonas antarctica TaxID=619304 RepID=A0A1N7M2M3_9GAMM|nr:diphosphomevalonate decarboxylase [Neptunomonas antarctica]SIS80328.1 diphosphomevalonate decarboxylase [Neptunomonas antarctica]